MIEWISNHSSTPGAFLSLSRLLGPFSRRYLKPECDPLAMFWSDEFLFVFLPTSPTSHLSIIHTEAVRTCFPDRIQPSSQLSGLAPRSAVRCSCCPTCWALSLLSSLLFLNPPTIDPVLFTCIRPGVPCAIFIAIMCLAYRAGVGDCTTLEVDPYVFSDHAALLALLASSNQASGPSPAPQTAVDDRVALRKILCGGKSPPPFPPSRASLCLVPCSIFSCSSSLCLAGA